VLALIVGIITFIGISAIDSATWDFRACYNLPEGNTYINPFGLLITLLILSMMILTRWLSQKREKVRYPAEDEKP
jgi:Zn-dependent protease with chaperone function